MTPLATLSVRTIDIGVIRLQVPGWDCRHNLDRAEAARRAAAARPSTVAQPDAGAANASITASAA